MEWWWCNDDDDKRKGSGAGDANHDEDNNGGDIDGRNTVMMKVMALVESSHFLFIVYQALYKSILLT